MPQFLLRMLIAITLLTVEVVLATAFVAHFTKPVESLKMWFRKHYRVTLAVVFPVHPNEGGASAKERLSPAPIRGYAADRTLRDADMPE